VGLNRGLQEFYNEIKEDSTTANRLELSIVTFGNRIDTVLDPSLAENFTMPNLIADQSSTRLVDGVQEAISIVEGRKNWYKQTGQPYYRPWIILITDGLPDGNQDVNGLSQEIQSSTNNKRFVFFAVGVQGADMNTLSKISNPSMPPAPLEGLKFSAFFKWLSASMGAVSGSTDGDNLDLPSPADWMKGFKI